MPSPPPLNAGQVIVDKPLVRLMLFPVDPATLAVIFTVVLVELPVTPTVEFVIAPARLVVVCAIVLAVPLDCVTPKNPVPVFRLLPPRRVALPPQLNPVKVFVVPMLFPAEPAVMALTVTTPAEGVALTVETSAVITPASAVASLAKFVATVWLSVLVENVFNAIEGVPGAPLVGWTRVTPVGAPTRAKA